MILREKKALEDLKSGKMIILVEDGRGYFICSSEKLSEKDIDFICLNNIKKIGICHEILNEDKSLLSIEELEDKAKKLDIEIVELQKLQNYIKSEEELLKVTARAKLPTSSGEFEIVGFENNLDNKEHIALVKGDVEKEEGVLIRLHSECFTGDILGSLKCDCGSQLKQAMDRVATEGKGVVLYLRQEGRGIGLINKIKAYALQDKGADTVEANLALGFAPDLRDYAVAAQMLKALKIKSVRVMTNNPEKIEGLEKYGVKVVGRESIETEFNKKNIDYMKTKKSKMRHILNTI